jgi:hypothetical protein
MNINDMTIGEAREIAAFFNKPVDDKPRWTHPLIGRRALVRTYSAGVHIGTLVSVNPDNAMECHLKDALRLWKWENGGLSLSAVAHNGIKGGRLNRTDEVTLTNAIEYIPTTAAAEATYEKFIED